MSDSENRNWPRSSSPLTDVTVSPIFLPMVPDRNPRTECGCHAVAFIYSLAVAPPGRLSRSRILAVLLPLRATGLVFPSILEYPGEQLWVNELPRVPLVGTYIRMNADSDRASSHLPTETQIVAVDKPRAT